MANFSKKETRGRHIKAGQKRDLMTQFRFSNQELAMFDILKNVLNERRNTGKSRMDLLTYLVEREYEKQQNLKPFNDERYTDEAIKQKQANEGSK